MQKSSGHTVHLEGRRIVNAAGAWASRLAKLIGYDTPVFAVRRQVSIFDVRGFDMSPFGMMVDTSGVYFHPEATSILGGYADHEEKEGWNLNYDGESFFQEKIWMPLYNRSTVFEQLKHLTGWGGLYEVSPDQMGVLGRVEGFSNVYENHGYSGRGAMQSYAAGRGLAELMHTGKFQTLDLAGMNGERFRKGALLPEGLLI
jgi:glycine/D-amino acid oxidase-like deaminating enzyme